MRVRRTLTRMNLYLLRHSNAEEVPPPGETGDRQRRLTSEGREKAKMIGRAIRRLDPGIGRVLTSPAPRARDTAQVVVSAMDPHPVLEEIEALWIGGDLGELVRRVRQEAARFPDVLLVGHEPDLGRMVSRWLTGSTGLRLRFRKGGLCKLAVARLTTGRCASLEWHLTPAQLRSIAGSRSDRS